MGGSTSSIGLPILLLITIAAAASSPSAAQSVGFRCNGGGGSTTCKGLVGYTTPNATTLSKLTTFFDIKNLRTLLAANNLSLSTPPTSPVPANQTLKIPFPCLCDHAGGYGVSNHRPNYTVVAGDDLDHIARDVFGGLVTFQQIQRVNNITNPDEIFVGQNFWVPLPCSCDGVDGEEVVHYGHVVAPGSTLEGIAEQYNASEEVLLRLNNLTSPKELLAGAVLDVPLKTCSSMVGNNSLDYPLLVPNGSYVFTANNCVRCNCDASVSWTLQCEPAQINSSCPAIKCQGEGNLFLGNTSSSSGGCNRTTCAYAGYTNGQNVLTTLATVSTCPASGNNNNDNKSSAVDLRGIKGWIGNGILVVVMHMFLLSTHFFSS